MTELTLVLNWMARIILILALLLLVVWLLIRLLGHLTRRKISQTDLDLVGREARVTRVIRPSHNGRISCTEGGKTVSLNATSAQRIAVGTVVLITAIDSGVARTIPKENSARPSIETVSTALTSGETENRP